MISIDIVIAKTREIGKLKLNKEGCDILKIIGRQNKIKVNTGKGFEKIQRIIKLSILQN